LTSQGVPQLWGFKQRWDGENNSSYTNGCRTLTWRQLGFLVIQISPTLTKLCHTKRDHLANFLISLELLTSKFAY